VSGFSVASCVARLQRRLLRECDYCGSAEPCVKNEIHIGWCGRWRPMHTSFPSMEGSSWVLSLFSDHHFRYSR
jgi:hypothetical protein